MPPHDDMDANAKDALPQGGFVRDRRQTVEVATPRSRLSVLRDSATRKELADRGLPLADPNTDQTGPDKATDKAPATDKQRSDFQPRESTQVPPPPPRSEVRISRIGNHEFIWRVDACGLALPSLKHLLPTCNAGLLLIRVKQARALANPSSFGGKQTPYVKLEIGKTKRKTPKLKHAGANPVWESTQQFSLGGGESDMMMTVLNKKGMTRDVIGRCTIPLEFLLQLANPGSAISPTTGATDSSVDPDAVFHEAWFEVRTTNKYAGEVLLRVQFFPDLPKYQEMAGAATEKTKGKKQTAAQAEKAGLEDIRTAGKSTKGKIKIFGGSLKAGVAVSKYVIPRVIKDCITYLRANGGLDEVGIFRIPGNHVTVEALKRSFDDNIDVTFENCHDCGALLKLYLRELREPLIPFAHYEHFVQVGKKYPGEQAMHALEDYRILIASLPQLNRDLLGFLIPFLDEVREHEQNNRMSVRNIAIVFAPNLLRPQDTALRDPAGLTSDMQHTIEVTEALIRYHRDIFPARLNYLKHVRGAQSRDMRGQSVDLGDPDSAGSPHIEDENKRASKGSSPLHQPVPQTSRTPSAGPDEDELTTQEEDADVDPEQRPSVSGKNEIDELRKELETAKANTETLKETIQVLMLQIEDLRSGAPVPLEESLPQARRQSTQEKEKANYVAMRHDRLGQLKAIAITAAAPEKKAPQKAPLSDSGEKGKGSSGNLLTSVGRTVAGGFASWGGGSRERASSRRGYDVEQYEVVNALRVRDAPSTSGTEIGILDVGQRVQCFEIRGFWLKHETGWSMIHSDPAKEGSRKYFLKALRNDKKNGTLDKPLNLAAAAAHYGAGLAVDVPNRKDDDSPMGPHSPKLRREALDSRGSTPEPRRYGTLEKLPRLSGVETSVSSSSLSSEPTTPSLAEHSLACLIPDTPTSAGLDHRAGALVD